MRIHRPLFAAIMLAAAATAVLASSAEAQRRDRDRAARRGNEKPRVTVQLALTATREILVAQGFEVVRVEEADGVQIVHYRRGNQGRGRGRGPVARMVIRSAGDSVEVRDAPVEIKASLELRLGIKLQI